MEDDRKEETSMKITEEILEEVYRAAEELKRTGQDSVALSSPLETVTVSLSPMEGAMEIKWKDDGQIYLKDLAT